MHKIKIFKAKKGLPRPLNNYKILSYHSKNLKSNQYKYVQKKVSKEYKIIQIISKISFIFIFYFLFNIDEYIISLNPISKIKVGLCVIGKNENLYVKEFVEHYKKLGYNHIYIYDNNDVNGEKFEEVLKSEIDSNYVSIINYRGKSAAHIIGGPQCKAFKDCYGNHKDEYDWLSFFDFDEFLEIKPYAKNIQEFLGNPRYKNCDNIKINFLFYSDNDLLYYDNRPVQERFTKPLYNHPDNNVVKSTVRGGLPDNYWNNKCCVHTSLMNVTNCNSQGDIMLYSSGNSPMNHTFAALKHYFTKSLEEYVNKTKRGDSFIPVPYTGDWKRKRIRRYFGYNKFSVEKENLFKKLFDLKDL